jgi:hypothetical protein
VRVAHTRLCIRRIGSRFDPHSFSVLLRDLREAITRENILLGAPKVPQHLSPEPQKEAPDFFGIIFHKEPIFLDTSYHRFIVLGSHDSCRCYQDASRWGFVGLYLHPQGVATEAGKRPGATRSATRLPPALFRYRRTSCRPSCGVWIETRSGRTSTTR